MSEKSIEYMKDESMAKILRIFFNVLNNTKYSIDK